MAAVPVRPAGRGTDAVHRGFPAVPAAGQHKRHRILRPVGGGRPVRPGDPGRGCLKRPCGPGTGTGNGKGPWTCAARQVEICLTLPAKPDTMAKYKYCHFSSVGRASHS